MARSAELVDGASDDRSHILHEMGKCILVIGARLALCGSSLAESVGNSEMDVELVANLATKTVLAVTVFLLIAWVAERSGPFMAGLLMTFPANSGTGFALIMYEQPREFLSNASLVSFAMTGPILVFMSVYVMASRRFGFALALAIGLVFWWGGAALVLKFDNTVPFALASAACGVLIAVAVNRLRYTSQSRPPGGAAVSWWPTIARAVVGGGVIASIAFFSGVIGPTWSGLLLAFPTMICGTAWILSHRFNDQFAVETLANSQLSLLSYSSFNLALHYAAGPLSGPAAVGACALMAVGVSVCVASGRRAN